MLSKRSGARRASLPVMGCIPDSDLARTRSALTIAVLTGNAPTADPNWRTATTLLPLTMPLVPPTSLLNSRASRLELARQQYFDEGRLPTGIVSDAVFESWSRCLRLRHSPKERAVFQPVTHSRSHLALQKNRELHQAWLHELPRLEAVLGISSCAAMLTDSTGVLIGATCAGRSHEELMPVATRVGVDLSEDAVGTTAPGIVARTGKPVRVFGAEHFFEGVKAMNCAAAPIRDITGKLAGVLDISSEFIPFGFDPAPVVGLYAGAIENHLLVQQSTDHLLVRFQVAPDLLDSSMVAMAGVDSLGRVAWTNGAARGLLGESHQSEPSSAESLLGADLAKLTSLPDRGAGLLQLPNGLMVWARVEMRARDGRRQLLSMHPSAVKDFAEPSVFAVTEKGTSVDVVMSSALRVNDGPQHLGDGTPNTAPAAAAPPANEGVTSTLRDLDRDLIDRTLQRCGGNVSEAARLLGVSRGLIYRRRGIGK